MFFYFPKIKSGFDDMDIIVSMSSSGAECCLIVFPHFSHLCVMIKPSLIVSTDIGFIMPPQFDNLSPGLLSTCREYKQCGQWFVYPLPKTFAPQLAHTKSSTRFVNFFIYKPKASRYILVNSSASSNSSGSSFLKRII